LAENSDGHRLKSPTRADLYWYDVQHRLPELELATCTRAAGALLTASSILLAAHGAIAPRKIVLVVVLELVAASGALYVLMPTRWRVWQSRPELIRQQFVDMLRKKAIALWIAFSFLAAAVVVWLGSPLWTR
jgi:hypothetical protein